MSKQTHSKQDIWGCIHGEMEAGPMKELKLAAGNEPGLREDLTEIQRAHHALQELMPIVDQSENELVNEILHAFDHEALETSAEPPAKEERPGKIISFPWPLAAAVAACFAVFLGIQAATSGPLGWSVAVTQQTARGDVELYSKKELQKYAGTLKSSVNQAYRKSLANSNPGGTTVKRKWKMDLKVEEPRPGALDVMVYATGGSPAQALEWHKVFDDRNNVPQELRQFADEIATQLATPQPAGP